MKVIVINSGSSSIKFQVLDMETETVLANGLVERIGEETGLIKTTFHPDSTQKAVVRKEDPIANHQEGMLAAIDVLTKSEHAVIKNASEIDAVGHRVVHGGEDFQQPVVIDQAVMDAISANIPLAPLHNPANLDGIKVAKELFPDAPQVAVFDTAFHQTMPSHAYMYALPYELYEQDKVRRYGFHGTSHKFVASETAKLLGKPAKECNLITVHLGNGCSMTAVKNGESIDTSLGMTPLEGLVMGTRSGDVDPAIHMFLHRNKGMDLEAIDDLLNRESGLKGLCGMNDMRDIHTAIEDGNKRAKLALDVQTYRVKKYLGAYMAVLGSVDAIVFTAGIGENDPVVRELSLEGLENFGIVIDKKVNDQRSSEPFTISTPESKVRVLVLPTNEELAIARETLDVVQTK
ncbi:acetate kinase [Desulfogranum japonicum]|uniref:acetate kinase n=1 Tax=Desulfogranum japonicum TaxID=231447 RepID=UPI000429E083|nr:acetate kinase [Desulfogranum japonicum]